MILSMNRFCLHLIRNRISQTSLFQISLRKEKEEEDLRCS